MELLSSNVNVLICVCHLSKSDQEAQTASLLCGVVAEHMCWTLPSPAKSIVESSISAAVIIRWLYTTSSQLPAALVQLQCIEQLHPRPRQTYSQPHVLYLAQLLQEMTLAPLSDFRPIANTNKQGGKEEVRTWDFRIRARLL